MLMILKLLLNHFQSEEEGVHIVVTECQGKIALIEPEILVTALKVYDQMTLSTSPQAYDE